MEWMFQQKAKAGNRSAAEETLGMKPVLVLLAETLRVMGVQWPLVRQLAGTALEKAAPKGS